MSRGIAVALLLLMPGVAGADVSWPPSQVLPSFAAPAPTQDLIFLRGAAARWEAEAPALGHATGRLDGDGWLCQVGIDAPDRHMIYGPYDRSLPIGGNTARYRLKIDNTTADDAPQVVLDVRDNDSGAILATRTVTRHEFTVASDWVTFALPFDLPAAGHGLELRVRWLGGAYLKVDWVGVDRGSEDALTLFASLKGVVNATQPRIFSYEGDAFAEGPHTWLQSLGLTWTEVADPWSLITKYRAELAGVIVYDDAQLDTMNLATTLAGPRKALVASAALLPRLTAAPYNLPVLVDLRGRFTSKLAVYESLLADTWPTLTHRVLVGLSPIYHRASAREYAVALGAAVVWLDPRVPAESALLDRFLTAMGPGASYLGWWPEEGSGVERGSRFGIPTIASDYATNLTVHGGMPRAVHVQPVPPKPRLANKIYVAFILSDGDNLQYVEHLMRKLWNDPGRGQVPIGWTVSPAMLDAMPGALDYYQRTSTIDDNLISGPSGYGYGYPNVWSDAAHLDQFAARTDDYARRAGLRVVTIWNTIVGGIAPDVGASFAAHAPSLLGLTGQNTGGGLTIYGGALPGFALSCNYCTNEQAMRDHIASAAAGWDHASPRFVLIQAQPWQGVTPTSFRNVAGSLAAADYAVVRPDTWFQLLRQTNGLPIEPIARIADGVYRVVNRASGKCVAATDGATVDGTVVQQATCAGGDAQRWRFTAVGNGYYQVATASAAGQGWDVNGGPAATAEGTPVVVWHYVGGSNQQWQPVWEEDGYYHLIARHSDRCLDVPSGAADEGLALQQWTCNGATAQAFRIEDPDAPPPPDAGVPPSDAGEVGDAADAGGRPDAGANPQTGGGPAGCGCAGTPDATGGAAVLLGAALLLRRRRRPARR